MKALTHMLLSFGSALIGAVPLTAQAPQYTVELLGPGTVINDMNEAGAVVGWTVDEAGNVRAYRAAPGGAYELLPHPDGFASAWAQGINDAGVIVGSVGTGFTPELGNAIAWTPDGAGGWSMQLLGQLAGHTQSVAYDVNNRGDIVGWSIVPGFQGGPTVWFNSPSGLLDIGALGAPSGPKEVNDHGVVVGISGGLFDLDTLTVSPLPTLPAGWTGFQGWAINDAGELAGTGRHGSQRSAAIWTHAGGWQSISLVFGQSANVQAFDINSAGVTSAEIPGPAARFAGVGTLPLASLLAPEEQGRWSFSLSFGGAVNDLGQIAAIGQDGLTGDSGAALLTPVVPVNPSFCDASDGSLAGCPCGNAGSPGTGCDVPQTTGGVGLHVLAQTTSPNAATLQGTGFPPAGSATAIVVRSSQPNLGTPAVFGDGLLCLDGASGLVRLAATTAAGGVSTHVIGHGAAAGTGVHHYQLWFRSTPAAFCDPAAAFNASSGRTLTW